MFCLEKDGKLWFCTNNQKDVYKDMQAIGGEVSVLIPLMRGFVSTAGQFFEDNMEVKEACMANPIVKGQYNTADNSHFCCFLPGESPRCDC